MAGFLATGLVVSSVRHTLASTITLGVGPVEAGRNRLMTIYQGVSEVKPQWRPSTRRAVLRRHLAARPARLARSTPAPLNNTWPSPEEACRPQRQAIMQLIVW